MTVSPISKHLGGVEDQIRGIDNAWQIRCVCYEDACDVFVQKFRAAESEDCT